MDHAIIFVVYCLGCVICSVKEVQVVVVVVEKLLSLYQLKFCGVGSVIRLCDGKIPGICIKHT